MGVLELCWGIAFGIVLAWVSAAGRGERRPSWAPYFAPGCAAWVCGCQGLLFRRQPDYMLAYVLEARALSRPLLYGIWAFAVIAVAWAGSEAWLSRRRGASVLAVGVAVLCGAVGTFAYAPRLRVLASTLEFQTGLGRSLESQPTFRTLLGVSLIGSLLPVAGAVVAVALDAFAARHRRA